MPPHVHFHCLLGADIIVVIDRQTVVLLRFFRNRDHIGSYIEINTSVNGQCEVFETFVSPLLSKRPETFLVCPLMKITISLDPMGMWVLTEEYRKILTFKMGGSPTDILSDRLVLRCIDERTLGLQTKRLTAKRINASSTDAEKQKKWPLLAPVSSLSVDGPAMAMLYLPQFYQGRN